VSYKVDLWGSHPSQGNDDCIIGADCGTLLGARDELVRLKALPSLSSRWAYACVVGPGGLVHEESNPDFADAPDDEDAGLSEFAMHQGMAHGTRGFNEAMGLDEGAPEAQPFRR
jgi:hypothetical protein